VSGGITPSVLTLALYGGELSSSRPGSFAPRERAPVTHLTRAWFGPRVDLDAVANRKFPASAGN